MIMRGSPTAMNNTTDTFYTWLTAEIARYDSLKIRYLDDKLTLNALMMVRERYLRDMEHTQEGE